MAETVRPLPHRLRLACEPLGLSVLAAVGVDARVHLPPQHLCDEILLAAECAAEHDERHSSPAYRLR